MIFKWKNEHELKSQISKRILHWKRKIEIKFKIEIFFNEDGEIKF